MTETLSRLSDEERALVELLLQRAKLSAPTTAKIMRRAADRIVALAEAAPDRLREHNRITQDRAIIWWEMSDLRPRLASELEATLGEHYREFEPMIRDGLIVPEFPDAKLGDSGQQYWRIQAVATTTKDTGQ